MPRVPLTFEVPTGVAYPGLTTSEGWSNVTRYVPAFPAAGTSNWFGKIMIADDYASGVAKIRLRMVANSSGGNVRINMAVQEVTTGVASDTAMTAIDAQTVAMNATAKTASTATFTLPITVSLSDTITFRVTRLGDDAADTTSGTMLMWDAHLDSS
jgi:hypothetical protein